MKKQGVLFVCLFLTFDTQPMVSIGSVATFLVEESKKLFFDWSWCVKEAAREGRIDDLKDYLKNGCIGRAIALELVQLTVSYWREPCVDEERAEIALGTSEYRSYKVDYNACMAFICKTMKPQLWKLSHQQTYPQIIATKTYDFPRAYYFLQECGADPNVRDRDGLSMLSYLLLFLSAGPIEMHKQSKFKNSDDRKINQSLSLIEKIIEKKGRPFNSFLAGLDVVSYARRESFWSADDKKYYSIWDKVVMLLGCADEFQHGLVKQANSDIFTDVEINCYDDGEK